MDTTLWIAEALLAAIFAITGTVKLTQPRELLAAGPMSWAADVTDAQFRTIGALEVLGAVGLVLAAALGAPGLTALAATGLALTMVGAIVDPRAAARDGAPGRPGRAARGLDLRRDRSGRPMTGTLAQPELRGGAPDLPASTYAALLRAADRWPERPAVSCLPDAARWDQPSTRTFAELSADVRRAAAVYAGFGVRRCDAVAILSVNCAEMITALLAAEAVGVAAPINPALAAAPAAELVRLSGARVIVAAGPELDERVWSLARGLAAVTGARALLALRPTAATGAAPELEPLAGATVAYLGALAADAPAEPAAPAPRARDLASFLHTGGTTGTPKLAARTHRNEVANACDGRRDVRGRRRRVRRPPAVPHQRARRHAARASAARPPRGLGGPPRLPRPGALPPRSGSSWSATASATMSGVPTVYAGLADVPVDADVSSLRMPIVGAAPLPPAVADAFRARTGVDAVRGLRAHRGDVRQRASPCPAPRDAARSAAACPTRKCARREIDETTGRWRLLPDGEVGTLVIRGPNVFAGYLVPGRDGPVPHHGDKVRDGWLDTGDLGVRRRRRLRPAVRPRQGPDHPRRPQHRPGGHRGRAARAPCCESRPPPSGARTRTPARCPWPTSRSRGDATVAADELRAWAAARVPEPAAAPKRVDVVDAIPLTAVGKPFKPELRRRAAEDAARDALAGRAADVAARLDDGTVVVSIHGADEALVREALAPFAFAWELG